MNIGRATRPTLVALLLTVMLSPAWSQSSSAQVSGKFSGLVYSRATGTFNSVLTLTNQGTTLYAPLTILISTGTPAVTVQGASSNGSNKFSSQVTLPNGDLLPNETQTIVVAFSDPTRVSFTPSVTSVTGTAFPSGLSITVTSPTSGQTPAGPAFLVTGTVAGPNIVGASLDGISACMMGNKFFINAFQPQTSSTTFTGTATDLDGGQNAVSVAISPASKGLRVATSPDCGGVAPLLATVSVTISTPDGETITGEMVDFGDGGGATSVTPGTPLQHLYSNPGLYTVLVTATTSGETFTQTALVPVLTVKDAFAPMQQTASLLRTALQNSNFVRAASLFSVNARADYQAAFAALGPQTMPTVAGYLATLAPVSIGAALSQGAFPATVNGRPGYLTIEFTPDNVGIWRVESW